MDDGGGDGTEESSVVASTFLSDARAAVDAELAQVDALLHQAGVSASAAELLPPMPTVNETSAGLATGAPPWSESDVSALYDRALEVYGVHANAEATQAKVRAIHERVQARRAALQHQGQGELPLPAAPVTPTPPPGS